MARTTGAPSTDALPTSSMTTLATYDVYADARRAVDRLSDQGFDVSRTAIVWHGLRRVERVTGRRTIVSAAGQGAIAGAWFGGFLGLLLALFTDLDTAELIVAVLTYLIVGALVGAAWAGGVHWSTGGRRDFSSIGLLEADRYEVAVAPELLAEARQHLGIGEGIGDGTGEPLGAGQDARPR